MLTVGEKKIRKAIAAKKYNDKNKDKKKQYRLNNPKMWTMSNWKTQGLITPDYNIIYNRYVNSTNCEQCGHDYSYYRKHMDHEHIDNVVCNFRAILCHKCNCNRRNKCNAAGTPNIYKYDTGWRYKVTYKKVRHWKQFKTKEEAIAYKTHYELTLFD
tara:strand:+ start:44 stop:514 length:471 start_codon:yes stop_codon:yes gene_type:complete